jgi:tungstate transport system permease protein
MQGIANSVLEGLRLVATLDLRLWEIVGLSLAVSLSAVAAATLLGLPLGAALAAFPAGARRSSR